MNAVTSKWAKQSGGPAGDEAQNLVRADCPYCAPDEGCAFHVGVPSGTAVRRLTPTECERLQALPDGWTNPDGTAPDSRRYAALGDAVTASVAEWIGRRIAAEVAR